MKSTKNEFPLTMMVPQGFFFTFQSNVYKKILLNSFCFGLGRHCADCATDQYVVGLDVGVEDAVPLEVLQS